jgi:hypothetical protein
MVCGPLARASSAPLLPACGPAILPRRRRQPHRRGPTPPTPQTKDSPELPGRLAEEGIADAAQYVGKKGRVAKRECGRRRSQMSRMSRRRGAPEPRARMKSARTVRRRPLSRSAIIASVAITRRVKWEAKSRLHVSVGLAPGRRICHCLSLSGRVPPPPHPTHTPTANRAPCAVLLVLVSIISKSPDAQGRDDSYNRCSFFSLLFLSLLLFFSFLFFFLS